MAVVPVGIAVSLITLYLLNRIGQKLLAFEHIFFLGLKYCMEPTPADLAAVAATSVGAAAFGGALASSKEKGSKGKKKGKHSGSSSTSGAAKKPKATPANLPVVRNTVNENMFIGDPTLPKSIEFSYMMGMVSSFLIAFSVEEGVMCLLPGTSSKFNVSQTHWFGALIFSVSMFELVRFRERLPRKEDCICLSAIRCSLTFLAPHLSPCASPLSSFTFGRSA